MAQKKCLSLILPMVFGFEIFNSRLSLAAPRTQGNAAQNVNLNPDGSDPSKYYGGWQGHTYFPSPQDWRKVGVYQFITDRFRDGDPTNNEGAYGGYNLYHVGERHGGDFRGVEQALPYIKSLGFDAIWISPVFQNRKNSYHSYAQIDFTLLDDRFGTLDDMRSMVTAAHKLGMYVIVDIVANHMDNLLYFEGHKESSAPFRLHDGEYRQFYRDENVRYQDFVVDNNFESTGRYSDVYGYDGFRKADEGFGSFWQSDFHHNGDLGNYDDVWQNHLGKIYGIMDDLRTSHPRVQEKIIAMTKALISSVDIDGIRMDTPMQIPLSFFKRWVPAVKSHARKLGKNNFFIFGEFYCPRSRAATMVGRGKTPDHWGDPQAFIDEQPGMDAGINYDLYFSFMGPAVKAQSGGVRNAFINFKADLKAYDFYNPARKESQYTMLNFFNNHDQWRLNWEEDGFKKSRLASGIIAFWPGIPLFYYGDEQGFSSQGTALDGWSREDFMTSKAWFDVKSQSKVNPAVGDNFNMTHPDYTFVQKLMNIRRHYPALSETDELYERWAQRDNSNGIFAYTRVWGQPQDWALVVFNTWRDPLEAGGQLGDFYTGWREGDRIVNVMDPKETATLGPGGLLSSLWVKGYEVKVFVLADHLKELNPAIVSVSPKHDQIVAQGVQSFKVQFSESIAAQSLKGAVRFGPAGREKKLTSQKMQLIDNGRTLVVEVDVDEGISKLVIDPTVRSLAGLPLYGAFSTRMRSGLAVNPIIGHQLDRVFHRDLVKSSKKGAAKSWSVVLQHQVEGASLRRISLDKGAIWSRWDQFLVEEEVKLIAENPSDAIWIQYWADGSAAYEVYDNFPLD